ncbi:hypothetical protein D3C80_1612360 [compost metagenome]
MRICLSATSFFQLISRNTKGSDNPIKAFTAMDELISGSQAEKPKVIISSVNMAHRGGLSLNLSPLTRMQGTSSIRITSL